MFPSFFTVTPASVPGSVVSYFPNKWILQIKFGFIKQKIYFVCAFKGFI